MRRGVARWCVVLSLLAGHAQAKARPEQRPAKPAVRRPARAPAKPARKPAAKPARKRPPPRPAKTKRNTWEFGAALALGYDDNVFLYSRRDIELFGSGRKPERFGVATIGDYFASAELDATKLLSSRGRCATYLDADVRTRSYRHDTVADDLRARLALRQQGGNGQITRLRLVYLPDTFLRRLWDGDTREYVPARYDYTALELMHRRRVAPRWALQGDVVREWRDYNEAFDERDSRDWVLGLTARYEPSRQWDLWLGYEADLCRARAADALPDVDADVSYDERIWLTGLRYTPRADTRWEFEWQHGGRGYTTGLTAIQDPYHAGRGDDADYYALQYRRRIDDTHALELTWAHEEKTVRLDPRADVSDGGEGLSYRRNVYVVRYLLDF